MDRSDTSALRTIRTSVRGLFKTILCLTAGIAAVSCGQKAGQSPDPEFSTWISAYSGGVLQTDATVKVVLNTPISGLMQGQDSRTAITDLKELDRLFSFSPAMTGTVRIAGDDILEFIPDEGEMKPGTSYKASFRLGNLTDTGDSGLDVFRFSFATAPKEVSMEIERMMISDKDPDRADVRGILYFSEPPAADTETKMLSCSYPDTGYRLQFERSDDRKAVRFSITGLVRGEEERELVISLNGQEGGFISRQEETVTIPSRHGFKVLGAELGGTANPYIDITFSQPVDKDFNPVGMFSLEGAGRTWTSVSDNIVRLYFESFGKDVMKLDVAAGIRSSSGERLAEPVSIEIKGDELKPAVEIPLKGNILPDNRELLLPLKAVNLSAVDISVIRIYPNNILSFLQDNELGDDNGLRRFGRLVSRQTVRLDTDPTKDLSQWQDFAVDLSGLFRQEPGAIYRIRVSFNQDYSLYGRHRLSGGAASEFGQHEGPATTDGSQGTETGQAATDRNIPTRTDDARPQAGSGQTADAGTLIKLKPDTSEEEQFVWDTPSPYYYESFYEDGYSWTDRDNPVTPSYYMDGSRFPYCNLMTSDIGIIAKSAGDGRIWTAVNNILTTAPVEGAEVTVYNYQLQVIGKAVTDSRGFADMETSGVPFAVTAGSGKSISYLKVTDGNEKSLSRFDTGGQKMEKGLKCFIYGERGVWRPGDTLHVSLMIDDTDNRLPDSHPVTMELYTPLGQFHTRMVNSRGTDGLYVFHIPTSSGDPTGTWNAWFKVGGSSFHKALMIETIKPNRLKISLKTSDDILQAGRKTRFSLAASWLTGPAAAGLGGSVEMILSPAGKTFEGYEDYLFNDPTVPASQTSVQLFDTLLDKEGQSVKDITIPPVDKAPGMMEARLVSRVAESGGDESITSQTSLYSPYPAYVGISMPESEETYLETDKDHVFKVIAVDSEGRTIAGHKLEYRIFKLDWSWWWESKADELDSYVNGTAAKPVSTGTFVSSGRPCEIPFRIDYPEWGRFLVYVKDIDGGHASGCIFTADWPAYRGRSDKKDPDALTMLTFSTDKKEYKAGEEATVFIPAAEGGRALVSLENGSRILSSDWVETSAEGDKPYTFTVTEDMSPNFYIHISLLQKHGNTSNDLPVRMYGVQPVMVSDEMSRLHPQISMPDAVRPLEAFSIKISERDRRGMTYTLAIVDEGLLDITAFRTPDPWAAMYAREALGVRTWDLYDNVIGAFGGKLTPMASIGGDQTISRESKQDNRFNPVVEFLGPFTSDGKENVHRITLPMYVGSVRVMVVAGKDGAYGNAEKAVPVRTPLMVLPTLPRSLAPGETVALPVNVFAMENPEPSVKVSVSVQGPVGTVSPPSRILSFTEPGDKVADFILKTTGEGTAKVTVTASGKGYTATETVSVPVRNPNPYITERHRAVINPGENRRIDYDCHGNRGSSAVLELASFPAMDVQECFRYMTDYGYDCSEQIAARGITLLSLKKFFNDTDRAVADSLIPVLLNRLYGRQLADGGFPVWPGQSVAGEWVTSMAGQFMSLASASGYEVNKGVMSAWTNFQKRCARNYKGQADGNRTASDRSGSLVQAYRLYSLALASVPEEGAMNRLRESVSAPDITKWMLASAYALTGKKPVAMEIISGLRTETEEYSPGDISYGSPLRDKAIMLESLVLADDTYGALDLAMEIAEASANKVLTTQFSAFMASATGRLADRVNTGALHAGFRYAGTGSVTGDFEQINSASAVWNKALSPAGKCVEIRNMSEGPVYASVTTRHRPDAGTKVPAKSSGIALNVSWTDLDGNPISPERLAQGADFRAAVTVSDISGTGDLTSLALSIPVPSGWEIFNERMYGAGTAAVGQDYDYMDVRDDRVIYYFDLAKGTGKTFTVRLRAAYKGEFTMPAISCEAMYSPETNARTASGKTTVE